MAEKVSQETPFLLGDLTVVTRLSFSMERVRLHGTYAEKKQKLDVFRERKEREKAAKKDKGNENDKEKESEMD